MQKKAIFDVLYNFVIDPKSTVLVLCLLQQEKQSENFLKFWKFALNFYQIFNFFIGYLQTLTKCFKNNSWSYFGHLVYIISLIFFRMFE